MPSAPLQDLTPEQSRAARALLKWSQVRLAAKSNVSEGTIRDFENEKRFLRHQKLEAIRLAFETAGVIFTVGAPSLSVKIRNNRNIY
ncbi:helix-turn-helix domain-containing protein [Mesorhizobium sp. ORM8.1]